MHSHRLTSGREEWLLEWDESNFILFHPNGAVLKATEGQKGYYLVDAYDVLSWKKIGFVGTTKGFKGSEEALSDLRAYLEHAIETDAEYREGLVRDARLNLKFCWIAFPTSAGLVGLYLWCAAKSFGLPPSPWIRIPLGFLIHSVLLILIAILGTSPLVGLKSLRLLSVIRRHEPRAP